MKLQSAGNRGTHWAWLCPKGNKIYQNFYLTNCTSFLKSFWSSWPGAVTCGRLQEVRTPGHEIVQHCTTTSCSFWIVCLCVCVQQAINTTPFQFSEQNEKKKKNTTHAQPSLGVCPWGTHSHTLTIMPTCLSIRFYHHRDTVDSFVCPEKIGALRSQTATFIMICKGCKNASACVFLCSSHTHTKKRSRMWTTGGTKKNNKKKPVCLFQHVRICASAFPCLLLLCFDVPRSAWAA